ncbi:MAG: hypothetical protein K0S55_2044 [Clostridia bacterium]|nr:hypothetical protein [Clostridia bacterium]
MAIPLFYDTESEENNLDIINYMFEPLEDETKDTWKDDMRNRYFFDDLSFRYYIEMFEGARTDYSSVVYKSVWNNIVPVYQDVLSGKKTSTEAVAAIKDLVVTEINQKLNHIGE